jgi:hypothetical protein
MLSNFAKDLVDELFRRDPDGKIALRGDLTHEQVAGHIYNRLRTWVFSPNRLVLSIEPREEDDSDDGNPFYRVRVISGPVRLIGPSKIQIGDSLVDLSHPVSEFAADFDNATTPGQALHAYADAIDTVLAREGWEARVGSNG